MLELPRNPRALLNMGRRFLRTQRQLEKAIRASRAAYYREAWTRAAQQTDSTIEPLDAGFFKISNGRRTVIVSEQRTPLNDLATDGLLRLKPEVLGLLTRMGVPVPRFVHLRMASIDRAESFLATIRGPVVVKPAYGTGAGAGVTTNVANTRQLRKAMAWSAAFCPETLVEEQLRGHTYRIVFLDGELLDCVVRRPPTVTGDGVSSIRQLIIHENRRRCQPGARVAQSLIDINLDTKYSLAAQGLTLRTKPDEGQVIKVKDVVNANRANENDPVLQRIAPVFHEMGRAILGTLGVRLVGVDVIAPTLEVDLEQSGGRVIELNTPPGFFYHELRSDQGFPMGARLLERLLRE